MPKTVAQLKADRRQFLNELKSIANRASNRPFTPAERKRVAILKQKDKIVQKQLCRAERTQSSQKFGGGIRRGRRAQPNNLTVRADGFTKDPKKGFKSPREFLMAVFDAGVRGGTNDPRLRHLAVGSDEQGTHDNSYGGFLVPEGFSPDVLTISPEDDPTTGRTTEIPMDTPSIKIPARVDETHTTSVSGGLTVSRREETGTASGSRMTFRQIQLEAYSLFGLAYATEELLTDSPISFVALLEQGFAQQFAHHMLQEKLFGTGAGEYMGVINSPCLISVAKEGSQAADTILYENVIKMRARCWGYSNAIWLANHDTLPQLMQINTSATNAMTPVWQPSSQEDHPDILLGRPIFFSEHPKTVGDQGDLILGNWGEFLEGLYQPLESEESIHVRFINHERTFKFWIRNAGAPWWKAALTPQNGATLSPFVVLDARA